MERLTRTMRQHVAARGRRSATPCKSADGLRPPRALVQVYPHFVLPQASGRQPFAERVPTHGIGSTQVWLPCPLAMAAGRTEHGWTVREVLLERVPPGPPLQMV